MAGLLDFLDTGDAQLGLGLLAAASARSDGAGFGQRLLEGVGHAQNWKQQKKKDEYAQLQFQQAQMQMEEMQRKRDDAARQRKWQEGLPSMLNKKVYGAGEEGPTMAPDTAGLQNYLLSPDSPFADKLLERKLFPKQDDGFTLSEGQQRFGPDGTVIAQVGAKPKEIDPNKPFMVVDGNVVANPAFQAYDLKARAAGASRSSSVVNMAAPENEYNKEVGKALATSGTALVTAAQQTPSIVANARAIQSAIDQGAITGTGAEYRLAVQKAAETFGMVEPGKAASTQQLMGGLAKLTLDGIKSSGLGGGAGFTNTDRDFLNSAISGQISDTPANMRRVAALSEKAAIATHGKGTKVLERWKQNPSLANVAQDFQIDAIPAPVVSAPKTNALMRGQVVDGYKFKGGNPADKSNWEKQ